MLQIPSGEITLQESITIEKNQRAPVIRLAPKLCVDDTVLEKPTLLLGQVSSGKSGMMRRQLMPRIFDSLKPGDAAVVFAAKREMVDGFYHPEKGDILLDYQATSMKNIWNIFAEMGASADPAKTLAELNDILFSGRQNTVQPFFTIAPKDVFQSLAMYLFKTYQEKTGQKPNHSTLVGFFNSLSLKDTVHEGRARKGLLTLIREEPELHHLADYLGDGSTAQALGVLGELRAVLNDVFQGGAFVRPGSFSARDFLKKGGKVFLLYDFAESTEACLLYYEMVLDQLIKLSLAENGQKVWFILDEMSLLGHLKYLQPALAFGRGNGFRLVAAIQSARLMEKNYSESEAGCMLGLFPNIFCFFTSDRKSRQLLIDRYGTHLVSVVGAGKAELKERGIIQDTDFYKITRPGDCIVSLAGYPPFFLHNYKNDYL